MVKGLFFALIAALAALADIVTWLRVSRVPVDQRSGQIVAGVCFAFTTILMVGVSIFEMR